MTTPIESMRLIQADCKTDALALDGVALSGLTVGANFGNLYAMVQAIARATEGILEREAVVRDPEAWAAVAKAGRS